MAEKKPTEGKHKQVGQRPGAELTSKRMEDLLEEGRVLRRAVRERFERARAVGEDAMRFLVR